MKRELLFELIEQLFGETKNIDEIAYDYSYAESTLQRFLSRIQPCLAAYGLTMTFKSLAISGELSKYSQVFYIFYYTNEQAINTVNPPEGVHQVLFWELSSRRDVEMIGM